MKRFLISILCGAVLVIGYFLFLAIFYQVYPISFDTLAILLKPLNLPYDTYKSIFGLYHGNPTIVKVLNFAAAIFLYSMPIYLALTHLEKIKRTKVQETQEPPEPPVY